ncbi:MAG: NAD-dependent epimerase/dehydratase family protein [Planctomycetota bacterium]|nr:MAG: NAD-dependent epimerase/dehydratase family protein [Planctomycetota bacterium]
MSSRETFLITGGAGFIGSHLVERLLAAGNGVIVMDDLSTGRIENIRSFLDHSSFEFIHCSIFERGTVEEYVRRSDGIFHLAAAVGVKNIVRHPVRSIETNIYGTQIVLNLANKYRKRILLTSTSEVYGKSEKVPFREGDDMLLGATHKPRWSYACSKAMDEFLALSFYRETALPVCIVRLFNTVGPRQVGEYGMVIPRFVEQALSGQSLTVYGDGNQVRCFIHVRDVVEVIYRLMQTKRAQGEIFNVGGREPITIYELARRVVDLTGSSSSIIKVPYEQVYGEDFEDIRVRVPDTSKLVEFLSFRPSYTLDDILREVIEDFRRRGQ